VTADVTRPDLPAVRVRPARSRSAIPPEAEATSQLAGIEALGALAVTKPLKVLDGELLVPPRGRHAASAPEESYRDRDLTRALTPIFAPNHLAPAAIPAAIVVMAIAAMRLTWR